MNDTNYKNSMNNEVSFNTNTVDELFPFQFNDIISDYSNISHDKKVNKLSKDEKIENKILYAKKNNKIKSEKKKQKQKEEWNMKSNEEQMILRQENKIRLELSKTKLEDALINGLNVSVDLYFDDEHSEFERKSLAKQLSLAYGLLKKAETKIHLHITSLRDDVPSSQYLKQQGVYDWNISRHSNSAWEVFPRDKIVLLSPDAEDVIESFEYDSIYVIGGIVDRSVRKSRTSDLAQYENLKTARLPLQEYIPNRQSHVLNIDTMVNIICNYLNSKDWITTLENAVPLRRKLQGGKISRKQNNLEEANKHNNNKIDSNVLIVDSEININLNDLKLI